jgi:hypothetical protein
MDRPPSMSCTRKLSRETRPNPYRRALVQSHFHTMAEAATNPWQVHDTGVSVACIRLAVGATDYRVAPAPPRALAK